jgi:hypothetical protein
MVSINIIGICDWGHLSGLCQVPVDHLRLLGEVYRRFFLGVPHNRRDPHRPDRGRSIYGKKEPAYIRITDCYALGVR